MSETILIEHLSLDYQADDGTFPVFEDVNLVIEKGSFVSVIGPSGCGKTSLLRLIANLETPESGTIRIFGQSPQQAADNRQCGFVFQKPSLFPWLNVEKNIKLPMQLYGLDSDTQKARTRELLQMVELEDAARKYPWQLSGGMQQRASLARALALDSPILLMDEPFAALDEILRDHLNLHLRQLWQDTKRTIIFVTHSISEAVYLSDKVVVMDGEGSVPVEGQGDQQSGGKIMEIEVDLPRTRPLEMRETPGFLAISRKVRAALRGHEQIKV